MANIDIGLSIKCNATDSNYDPLPNLDSKYGPYDNILLALTSIPIAERAVGLTVGIKEGNSITEYWFNGGTADDNLSIKQVKASNYTAEVEKVSSSATANAKVTLDNDVFRFSFDLPKGTPGIAGPKGDVGPIIYPAGIYNMNTTYIGTVKQTPYVYDLKMKAYYVLDYIGEYTGSEEGPISNPSDDPSAWKKMGSFGATYDKLDIIPNGLIGSAVFNGDFMFSQDGINQEGEISTDYHLFDPQKPIGGSFTPNVCINFKTGDAHVAGGAIYFKNKEMTFGNIVLPNVENPFRNMLSKIKNTYFLKPDISGQTVVDDIATEISMGSAYLKSCSSKGATISGVLHWSELALGSASDNGNSTQITLRAKSNTTSITIEDLDSVRGVTITPTTIEFFDNSELVTLTFDKLKKLLALIS